MLRPTDLLAKIDSLIEDRARTESLINQCAMAYAREQTLAYSKAHPRRVVTFCAAMGSTCLHVERFPRRPNDWGYQLTTDSRASTASPAPPAFLAEIEKIETAMNIRWDIAGSLRFECKGGKVISDQEDW